LENITQIEEQFYPVFETRDQLNQKKKLEALRVSPLLPLEEELLLLLAECLLLSLF